MSMGMKSIIFALLFCIGYITSIQLDIHLNLDPVTYELAIEYNQQVNTLAPNDQIFLGKISIPHVTLYLTDFQNDSIPYLQEVILNNIDILSKVGESCQVEMTNIMVSAQYGMWNATVLPCLQYLSDFVVNNTYQYITPNQSIPSWVYALPEPIRSEKIAMITKYGSPNVFSQFQPHITLAWDAIDNLVNVFDTINIQPHQFYSPSIGIGNVGDYGTVLDNQYGTFNFENNNQF
ncbi:hypothetical protein DLAC_07743 [Tieghemostelium lacteum]|uniref:Uncharacterized protein n=1 Tax=Tieghemostelium lacteum TaxID=361077 RepID=A0A151ZA97_TIELA|nr:hypothetical protein DLAC_07743 [Tieghemostelium lacteum]|eukprot:KYQ90872.1 hypothetical protein DLAC_07743 [Tieghemostelium lacteum]